MPISMFLADIQPDYLNMNKTQVECSIESAIEYDVPPSIVLALADLEGGKPNLKVKNTDGTFDHGYMQINTVFLKDLNRQYGITAEDVMKDDCVSFKIASKRVADHIKNDQGSFLQKVANYHSKTDTYNTIYQSNLLPRIMKWIAWQKENNILYSSEFEEYIVSLNAVDTPDFLLAVNSKSQTSINKPNNAVVTASSNNSSYKIKFEEAVKNRNISIPVNF